MPQIIANTIVNYSVSTVPVAFNTDLIFLKDNGNDTTSIIYYGNPNSTLLYTTFVASDSIASLISASNGALVQATIWQVDQGSKSSTPTTYAFPSAGSQIVDNTNGDADINSGIYFKGKVYWAEETQEELVAAANTGSSASSFEIDVFLIGGQSNAQGMGNSSGGLTVESGIAYQYYSSDLTVITADPVGNASTGSAWPAFIDAYYNLTGRKICLVPSAMPSTSQVSAANTGAGTWDTDGTLYPTSVTNLNNALTALIDAGYTPILKGILWCQGETDAAAITATTITKSQYKTALQTMIANYRSTFGANLPFYIFRTGGVTTTGITAVREAQEETNDEQLFTYVVFRNAADFPSRGLQNGAHYLQAGYDEMGKLGAEFILGLQKQTIFVQSDKIGINTKQPAYNLDLTGTLNITSTSNFGGSPTFNADMLASASTINAGAAATPFNIGYFKTLNGGSNNDVVIRTTNSNKSVIFQNGATEAARFVLTTGNLLLGTTTDIPKAILNLNSTTKVFLPPRMTATQASALSLTATEAGGIIYVTSTNATFTSVGWWGWNGSAFEKLNN